MLSHNVLHYTITSLRITFGYDTVYLSLVREVRERIKVNEVRVSVAARCRLTERARYMLIVSLNGLRRGERSLAPVGGGVKVTNAGKRQLIKLFGANSFEKGNDLRFRLPAGQLDELSDWLEATKELETNAARREFYDEVVDERHLLTRRLAQSARFTHRELREGWMNLWSYPGGRLELTRSYGFEQIYDDWLPNEARQKLVQAAQQPNPLVEFVSEKEIRSGRSHRHKSNISPWTKLLLPER